MPAGAIKFYNADKGFGFIEQDQGEDLFFHISSVDIEDPEDLITGRRVNFEIGTGRKGPEAQQITLEKEAPKETKPEMTPESEETKPKAKSKPESKEDDVQKPKRQQQKSVMNAFFDEYIELGEALNFHFSDGSKFQAKLLARDNYHLKVETDDKIVLIFKHALESVEAC